MRAAVYIRVANQQQAHEAAAEQYRRLSEYAREQGYSIVRQYSDIGFPGTMWQRKGLQTMLEDAEKGVFDAVVVASMSCLTRTTSPTVNFPFEVISLTEDPKLVAETERVAAIVRSRMGRVQ